MPPASSTPVPGQGTLSCSAAPPPDPGVAGPDADPESVARVILLAKLAGRACTRAELATALAAKNVPADAAARVLDRFEEVGLIDDLAFARLWVTTRQVSRGATRRVLAAELQRKGVAAHVTAVALAEVDEADEEASARQHVRKKLPSLARLDQATATRRLIGQLARKGHSPGYAARIVREELSQAGN
ncbi:MAG: regulatory protein RecX [Nocardioides sp.]